MKNKFLYMWELPFLRNMGNRLIQIKERANIPLIIYVTWNCTETIVFRTSRAWEKLRLLRPYIPFSSLMFSK